MESQHDVSTSAGFMQLVLRLADAARQSTEIANRELLAAIQEAFAASQGDVR